MTLLQPYLTNGRQSDQSIWQVLESGTGVTGLHRVGTRGMLEDGRVFYYARSSGAAIVAGNMLQMPIVAATFIDLVVATDLAGQTTINPTNGAVTALQDAFAGGYICIINGTTGAGQTLPITSHPAWASASAVALTIDGPLPVSLNADCKVTVTMSPWADVVISGVNQDHMAVGVSNVAVPAGSTNPQFFWCQTWGTCAVWQDEASARGSALSSGTTAGQVELKDATSDQIVGQVQTVVGTIADFSTTFLTIAP